MANAVKVRFYDQNPTAAEDYANSQLPLEDQFPVSPPPARYIYATDGEMEVLADSSAYRYTAAAGELLRCSTAAHPSLSSAQAFFDRKRQELRWSAEEPIYRTARFWVKRIFRGGNHE